MFLVFPESQHLALIFCCLTNPWSSRPRRAPRLPAPPGPPLRAAAPPLCWPRAPGSEVSHHPLHSGLSTSPSVFCRETGPTGYGLDACREIYSRDKLPQSARWARGSGDVTQPEFEGLGTRGCARPGSTGVCGQGKGDMAQAGRVTPPTWCSIWALAAALSQMPPRHTRNEVLLAFWVP